MARDAHRAVSSPAPWWGADRKQPHCYQGLRMKTDTNVHEQVDAMIAGILPARAVPGRKPKVLDLGCGEGALSQRLYDQGYDVLAVDADETRFMAQARRSWLPTSTIPAPWMYWPTLAGGIRT